MNLASRLAEIRWISYLVQNPRHLAYYALTMLLTGSLAGGLGYWLESWWWALAIGLVVVLVIALVVLAAIVLRNQDRQRRDRGTGDTDDALAAEERRAAADRARLTTMRERFQRGLDELRRSQLGRQGFYEFPWLLVIGERGAGKSSAVRESGLDLPAEYARLLSDGPTEGCDWWLTNEAVVLDASGILLDADQGPGRAAWWTLLRMIRKARKRLPLNGLVVAVPVETLLGKGAREIEEEARRVRRRLNELGDVLRVDLPIYVVVTRCDHVQGFSDVVGHLPPLRLGEAFGWTNNERRFADAGDVTRAGLATVRERIDAFLPEMLLREADADRKRNIFRFPDEFETLAQAVITFTRRAFAPSVYEEPPFLRGVYFASARREGAAVSPLLQELGQDWARSQAVETGGDARAFFLRDLFRQIIVGDQTLAVRGGRGGRWVRRLVLGTAGVAALAVLALSVASARANHASFRALEKDARTVRAAPPDLAVLDNLRLTIERVEKESRVWWRRFGFGGVVDEGLRRAQRTYTWAFHREFEDATKANLVGAVRRYDDDSFEALTSLAQDVSWLARVRDVMDGGDPEARRLLVEEGPPPLCTWAPNLSGNPADCRAYELGYGAFSRWELPSEIQRRIETERELLTQAAATLLTVERLERWSELHPDRFPPARYGDVQVPEDEGLGAPVTGAYTRRAWDQLVSGLLHGIDQSGGASRDALDQFRRGYVRRFDAVWHQYLMEAPIAPIADPDPKNSPWIRLAHQINDNVRIDLPRDVQRPEWMSTLEEVLRKEPKEPAVAPAAGAERPANAPPPARPPGLEYADAIDAVYTEVQAAQAHAKPALQVAQSVATGQVTTFRQGLDRVRTLVPNRASPVEEQKLREILSMPILNAFSALLQVAVEAIDERWRERIAEPFGARLSAADLGRLYHPVEGELDKFKAEVLGAFYEANSNKPAAVLEDREMRFGREFLDWMKGARAFQKHMFPKIGGQDVAVGIRIDGIPARGVAGSQLFVSERQLSIRCGGKEESFRYREGRGHFEFTWTPDCDEVVLRVWVQDRTGGSRELKPVKQYRGPLAFPEFLQEGLPMDQDRYQWQLRYSDTPEVVVDFRVQGGDPLRAMRHERPPQTVRE